MKASKEGFEHTGNLRFPSSFSVVLLDLSVWSTYLKVKSVKFATLCRPFIPTTHIYAFKRLSPIQDSVPFSWIVPLNNNNLQEFSFQECSWTVCFCELLYLDGTFFEGKRLYRSVVHKVGGWGKSLSLDFQRTDIYLICEEFGAHVMRLSEPPIPGPSLWVASQRTFALEV